MLLVTIRGWWDKGLYKYDLSLPKLKSSGYPVDLSYISSICKYSTDNFLILRFSGLLTDLGIVTSLPCIHFPICHSRHLHHHLHILCHTRQYLLSFSTESILFPRKIGLHYFSNGHQQTIKSTRWDFLCRPVTDSPVAFFENTDFFIFLCSWKLWWKGFFNKLTKMFLVDFSDVFH